ncbi:MAG: FliM/FliN family flagellar motor switch protein [Candidatus Margulisbacteria bacterium]|nr:FliM/FliN family flagellar motor switch protein [Candidatus Margulisiibacteriota bacterium]
MVVSMEIKLPLGLGQWHLYQPETSSVMKEELSDGARKKILSELNIFSKWMESISLKAQDKYQLVFSQKDISYNKIYSNDLGRILGNNLTVEYQDKKGAFLFSLDSSFLRNILGMYFGVDMVKLGGFTFTDMELVLIKSFYSDFFAKFFVDSGFIEKEHKLNFHDGKFGTMKYIAANQDFINIKFSLGFPGNNESSIDLFYSEHVSKNFLERIAVHQTQEVVLSDNMKSGISTEVAVQFGQAKLTFGEFMNIQKGDVLVLNSKVGDKIKFILADQLAFVSSVGQSEGKYAIKLEEQIIDLSLVSPKVPTKIVEKEETKEEELLMSSFDKVNIEEEKKDQEFGSVLDDNSEDEEFDWEKL